MSSAPPFEQTGCPASTPEPSEKMTRKVHANDFGRDLPVPHATSKFDYVVRQRVLLDSLRAFEEASDTRKFHQLAQSNLQRWRREAQDRSSALRSVGCEVSVVPGDWGVVTSELTAKHGTTFAVLNMANAHVPGGGYTEGCPAQEENMFRRTDCHFSIDRNDRDVVRLSPGDFDIDLEYAPSMTSLLNGRGGRVYLDTNSPRVCIRGPEDLTRDDLGYEFLPEDQIFPFFELRAAAMDLRGRKGGLKGGLAFNEDEMRRRIAAQLQTLKTSGVRHVVLSAFGCGAFRNPAKEVAILYREEIERCEADFDVVAFAIFHAGYGPDNFSPFCKAFEGFGGSVKK